VEAALVIGWLQRWVLDILRFALVGSIQYHPQRQTQIARRAEKADPQRLGRYQQELLRARALASHPLNSKLFLEELIIGYRSAAA
jgi:DNA polymerase-3 subunit delta'